ncbi:glycosyltransferase [Kibdelosporangium philippinense]|uniref:Glycosyltransferase n=1 Tax=Kibdelosporangium philippinense TaxID=211113 RepID=A0ABS8Z1P0_9PSEU|nr:glycosyltransferase [Kibdelosporangium philippinense]MCE7001760.1 glycosyltransferase [Kibdelosporangium philippinense]
MSSRWVRRVYYEGVIPKHTGSQPENTISIAILAKDEERCIARCLDSVVGRGFDVLVVDTGSTDNTVDIVTGYADVRLLHLPWPGSFSAARNFAIDSVAPGWIVFIDADEWLTERTADELPACLESLGDPSTNLVYAPRILEVDTGVFDDSIPRIFRTDSQIRFRGPVHEYPVITGNPDTAVGLVGLDLEFGHDGYRSDVVRAKDKPGRNLELLDQARQNDPENPRWYCFTIRDALLMLDRDQIVALCSALEQLLDSVVPTGDVLGPRHYYGLGLSFACQGLVMHGDWQTVHRYCDRLDALGARENPDAHYFRTMSEMLHGVVTERDLLRTVKLRRDEELVATGSAIDPSGRHLDALIAALVAIFRGEEEAATYRTMCAPWNDVFFQASVLRVQAIR